MRILVTAGPTREYFDALRFFSNPSSGRMGYEVARAAKGMGHRVTLVSGPVALEPPRGVEVIPVETAAEMRRAVVRHFRRADALVMTAAVSDYRPAARKKGKIPRKAAFTLRMVPTDDIVAGVARRKGRRKVVGFALEVGAGALARAQKKLVAKNLDLLVLNGPENLGSSGGRFTLLASGRPSVPLPPQTKAALARKIVEFLEAGAEG